MGVPQCSVLGPLLWGIRYNDALNISDASQATTVVYANDITVIVVAGLELAADKIDSVWKWKAYNNFKTSKQLSWNDDSYEAEFQAVCWVLTMQS